jgi:hypothetical protein
VYQLSLRLARSRAATTSGSASTSSPAWTSRPYDLLFKNGIRVGRAPISEWSYLRGLMEKHPARTQKLSFTGTEAKAVELEFKKGIDEQTIFYYDGQNNTVGRSFENCENVMGLSFQPAPRQPAGTVRVALCPVVRSLRRKIQFNWLNEEREIQFVRPRAACMTSTCGPTSRRRISW